MQINLLPDVVLARRREEQVKRLALIGLVAWFGLLVVAIILSFGYRQFESVRLSSATNTKNQLDAQVNSPQNKAFRAEAQEVQASLKALDQLFNHQQKMSLVNARIAALTPHEVQLHNVQISAGDQVQISATASSYADAGKLVAALKDSKQAGQIYFTDVALNGANLDNNSVDFSVTAAMVYPDGLGATQ